MKLTEILNLMLPDLNRSLAGLAPELMLVVTIVLLLVVRLLQRSSHSSVGGLAMAGTILALIISLLQFFNVEGIAVKGVESGPPAAETSGGVDGTARRAYSVFGYL